MKTLSDKFLAIPQLDEWRSQCFSTARLKRLGIWQAVVEDFDLDIQIINEQTLIDLNQKSVIVVANHPHGLLEAFLMGYLLNVKCKQNEFKFIANKKIESVLPELADYLMSVDNMSLSSTKRKNTNREAIKKTIEHLKQRKIVVIFPAGAVSGFRFFSPEGFFKVTDPEWKNTPLRLMKETQSVIVPIFISGQNSWLYTIASLFGNPLKRLISFREFLKSHQRKIKIIVGKPIDTQMIENLPQAINPLYFLRSKIYELKTQKVFNL